MSEQEQEAARDNSFPGETVITCPECSAGLMRLQYITYFTWLDGELVTVPNFPAWICDLCGRRDFDSRAITWLNTLLSPNTGQRSRNKFRRRGAFGGDRPATP